MIKKLRLIQEMCPGEKLALAGIHLEQRNVTKKINVYYCDTLFLSLSLPPSLSL